MNYKELRHLHLDYTVGGFESQDNIQSNNKGSKKQKKHSPNI